MKKSKQPTTTKKPKLGKPKKKPSISLLKKKLWVLVSKRIKERDSYICFTSYKKVEGSNAHCGHMFPSGACGALLRYHPKNLHCQSYNENINLGGNGVVYGLKFVEIYGQKEMSNLIRLKNSSIKADVWFYQNLIDLYSNNSLEEIEEYLNNLA